MGKKDDEGFQDGAHTSVLSSWFVTGATDLLGGRGVEWTSVDVGSKRLVLSMFSLRCF